MQSLAGALATQDVCDDPGINLRDFVPFFLDAMKARKLSQRELGLKAGLTKSRIGLILHKVPDKRASMTFVEFQLLLRALGISHGEAIIAVELQEQADLAGDGRFQTSIKMLCDIFYGLPPALIGALAEIGGFDGSEIRKEWAPTLQTALIEAVLKQVDAVMHRRDKLTHLDRL